MRLIFDHNLSPSLIDRLEDLFPDSTHVYLCGLGKAMDIKVWEYAKAKGFNIVSKDADYGELSMAKGYPPKVVWIRRGNCSTTQIEELIRKDVEYIRQLDSNPDLSVVSIGMEDHPTAQESPAIYRVKKPNAKTSRVAKKGLKARRRKRK